MGDRRAFARAGPFRLPFAMTDATLLAGSSAPGVAGAASITVRLVYLARLREALGAPGEAFPVEAGTTVGALVHRLRARGGAYAHELGEGRAFRVAVNHALATAERVLHDQDEVALLPPVTGG